LVQMCWILAGRASGRCRKRSSTVLQSREAQSSMRLLKKRVTWGRLTPPSGSTTADMRVVGTVRVTSTKTRGLHPHEVDGNATFPSTATRATEKEAMTMVTSDRFQQYTTDVPTITTSDYSYRNPTHPYVPNTKGAHSSLRSKRWYCSWRCYGGANGTPAAEASRE
jgi:hypothetical protein